MIDATKITTKAINQIEPIAKKMQSALELPQINSVDLNSMPHYKIFSTISCAKETLASFNKLFGPIKSPSYINQKILSEPENASNLIPERDEYAKHLLELRKFLWSQPFNSFEQYTEALKDYTQKNGAYINCNETADIVNSMLTKKGIKSQNVLLYATNKDGSLNNDISHVFNVIGLKQHGNLQDTKTWENASICDPWAKIASRYNEAMETYKKIFNINPEEHNLCFRICPNLYPNSSHIA